jgi:hypothetical protein
MRIAVTLPKFPYLVVPGCFRHSKQGFHSASVIQYRRAFPPRRTSGMLSPAFRKLPSSRFMMPSPYPQFIIFFKMRIATAQQAGRAGLGRLRCVNLGLWLGFKRAFFKPSPFSCLAPGSLPGKQASMWRRGKRDKNRPQRGPFGEKHREGCGNRHHQGSDDRR